MAEHYETKSIRRQTGTRTVQKHKGLIKPKKVMVEEPIYEYVEESLPTGKASDTEPDSIRAGRDLEKACNALAEEGYTVISITPIMRGVYGSEKNPGSLKKGTGSTGFSYGFGYSVTESLLIVAKLEE